MSQMEFTPEDIASLATLLRGTDNDPRGPVAFVVGTRDSPFATRFAEHTAAEGPVELFRSLHEARAWIARQLAAPARKPMPAATTWADPDRHGTVIVGERQRDYTTRELIS